MLKKIIYYLLTIAVLASVMWFQQYNKPHYTSQDVLGSSSNLALIIQPEAGEDPIVNVINQAKKDILVEDYLLSDKAVISALEQAQKRNVDVEVMLEQHPFGGGSLNPKTKQELEQAGVKVEWANPTFALTHEKCILIDDNEALILSQNLTAASFKSNREYDIADTNPQDVAEIKNIFIADWQRINFTPTQTNLVISPLTSRPKLETLLNSATKSLEIEMEVIDDKQIESILTTKAKTIPIELILPDMNSDTSNQSQAQLLKNAGVQIHTLKHPYIHAKMIMVDDQRVYVGSINFTTASLDENRELGIIISKPDIVDKINQTFESDWTASKAL